MKLKKKLQKKMIPTYISFFQVTKSEASYLK